MFTAFLVNLDRSPDRLIHMQIQAQRTGLSFERVPAVDGVNVPTQLRDKFFVDGQLGSPMAAGEIGCYASHLLIYSIMLDRGLDDALILEDDVWLDADLVDVVKRTLIAAPKGWDIIKLCNKSRHVSVGVRRIGERHIVRFTRQPVLTGAYLISATGAAKMLAPGLRTVAIDEDMRRSWELGLEVYGVLPEPVKVDQDFGSIIREMGRQAPRSIKIPKIRRRDEFAYAAKSVGGLRAAAATLIGLAMKCIPESRRPTRLVIPGCRTIWE